MTRKRQRENKKSKIAKTGLCLLQTGQSRTAPIPQGKGDVARMKREF
jgi:hypothetical protein